MVRGDALEHPRAARPALGAGVNGRPWHELAVGGVLAALAVAGAYWQAERTASFERQDGAGETLRLVCPLH
jgi:hypothetical protein